MKSNKKQKVSHMSIEPTPLKNIQTLPSSTRPLKVI
jgi:hypothetical protein